MKANRSNSVYKTRVVWNTIKDSVDNRQNFIPKHYTSKIEVVIDEQNFIVKSYSEFSKLITTLLGKYGTEQRFSIRYEINYDKLVDIVEKRYSELIRPKKKKFQ